MTSLIRLDEEAGSAAENEPSSGRTLKAVFRAKIEGTKIYPKAGEIVEMDFAVGSLSLAARKTLLLLMENAGDSAGQELDHVITKKHLRGSHDSNDRLSDILDELMNIKVRLKTTSKQNRAARLTAPLLERYVEELSDDGSSLVEYRFSEAARLAIAGSDYYAQIRLAVAMAFKSKYSLSLYEIGSLYLRRRDRFLRMSLSDLRARIGIEEDKYKNFAQFRREVLARAKAEIDQLADFEMSFDEIRGDGKGRPIREIQLNFLPKDADGINEAANELGRPKVGREARRSESVVSIVGGTDALPKAKVLFPSGSLHYQSDTQLSEILAKHGAGWDRDVIAEAYRTHMGTRLKTLSGAAMYKSFAGFCEQFAMKRGAAR